MPNDSIVGCVFRMNGQIIVGIYWVKRLGKADFHWFDASSIMREINNERNPWFRNRPTS